MRRRGYTIRKPNAWKITRYSWNNWHLCDVYSVAGTLTVITSVKWNWARECFTPSYFPAIHRTGRRVFGTLWREMFISCLAFTCCLLSDFLLEALWSSSPFNFRPNKVNLQVVYWFCFDLELKVRNPTCISSKDQTISTVDIHDFCR
jgi:hypothetical protein